MNTSMALGQSAGVLLQLFASLLIADFCSGVLHWVEDRYLTQHWPIVGKLIVNANNLHHAQPRAFTGDGFWLRNWPSLFVGLVLAFGFWLAGWVTVFTVSLVAVSSILPTQAHYWAHLRAAETPAVVRGLQRIGLLQSPQHHWRHHRGAKDNYFCTMTNLVNPVLEHVQFFQRLEKLITFLAGAQPKTA
ncbi:MAG: fatty acid desaturase CarF family protein [Pseudomonadota bacterium]